MSWDLGSMLESDFLFSGIANAFVRSVVCHPSPV